MFHGWGFKSPLRHHKTPGQKLGVEGRSTNVCSLSPKLLPNYCHEVASTRMTVLGRGNVSTIFFASYRANGLPIVRP